MSGAQHTPGPWVVSGHTHKGKTDYLLRVRPRGSVNHICGVHKSDAREANARLIASAPDLLAAVEAFLHYDATIDDGGVALMLNYATARDLALAAIAKARGQQ